MSCGARQALQLQGVWLLLGCEDRYALVDHVELEADACEDSGDVEIVRSGVERCDGGRVGGSFSR